jgi:AcrR family transcriptional regulator
VSPRRSAAEALHTEDSIVRAAVAMASTDGLEGITIGRLATDVGMSKAGVLGHFRTKEQLQLATLEQALELFREHVWNPVEHREPGLPRLLALCDSWLSYLKGDVFPGGCFLTAASCEFDGRGGPVREAVAAAVSRWLAVLEAEVRRAVKAGEMAEGTDPRLVAFQLNAYAMGANQAIQLSGDRAAAGRARRAMRAALGRPGERSR